MQVSVLIFRTDLHKFSALAVDVEKQVPYAHVYHSIPEVVDGLETVGLVTECEALRLPRKLRFHKGVPIFKGTIDDDALTDAGFVLAA